MTKTQTNPTDSQIEAIMTSPDGRETAREILTIFEAIAGERGGEIAREAALTLIDAAERGRLTPLTYWARGMAGDEPFGCVVGWIGHAIGVDAAFEDIPGWRRDLLGYTPVERYLIQHVTIGDTAERSPHVAALVQMTRRTLDASPRPRAESV